MEHHSIGDRIWKMKLTIVPFMATFVVLTLLGTFAAKLDVQVVADQADNPQDLIPVKDKITVKVVKVVCGAKHKKCRKTNFDRAKRAPCRSIKHKLRQCEAVCVQDLQKWYDAGLTKCRVH